MFKYYCVDLTKGNGQSHDSHTSVVNTHEQSSSSFA